MIGAGAYAAGAAFAQPEGDPLTENPLARSTDDPALVFVAELSAQPRLRNVSAPLAALLGRPRDALRDAPLARIVHAEDVTLTLEWAADVSAGRAGRPLRARFRREDGTTLFVECEGIGLGDRPVIACVVRDLSAEAHAETDAVAGIEVDDGGRRVRVAGQPLPLTRSEFDLLLLLLEQRGRVLSADEIAREVWGYHAAGSRNFLQAHVSRLRRKLRTVGAGDILATVRGVGYVIR